MKSSFAIIGAGIVGVTIGIELQRLGYHVTLLDKSEPAQQASRYNAGVIARSSLVPLNNPQILSHIPAALSGRSAGIKLNWHWLINNPNWVLKFITNGFGDKFNQRVKSLNDLIQLSITEHTRLLQETKMSALLNDNGWLFLHQSNQSFDNYRLHRNLYDRYHIDHENLNQFQLHDLEPALNNKFKSATWIKDAYSVKDSHQIVLGYFREFKHRGGEFNRFTVSNIEKTSNKFHLHSNNKALSFDQVIIAAGAWSRSLLNTINLDVPLAVERGYLMRYQINQEDALNRPVFDIAGGYVLSPRNDGIQISTGVDLTDMDYKANPTILEFAERRARQIINLGPRGKEKIAVGNRPSLPDACPIIGQVPKQPGLWLAFGHQHIGFSTAPGTAKIIGALITNKPTMIDATLFSPKRYVKSI